MQELVNAGAELVEINWKDMLDGILHTKFIIVDDVHFYIGSANMDWRSLSQVKELGIVVKNCGCLATDLGKIFNVYYYMGSNLKSSWEDFYGWPQADQTSINMASPLGLTFNGNDVGSAFISSAPAQINPPARTNDITALLNIINNSTKYVYGNVMDFTQLRLYSKPTIYWAELDTAFRNAMLRNVHVKLLISYWNHTDVAQIMTMNSLYSFRDFCKLTSTKKSICNGTLEIKMYQIPDSPLYEPYSYTRVNHAKYVTSNNGVYISTSNWSWDYFYSTGGVSFLGNHPGMIETATGIFDRDWNSPYAQDFEIYLKKFHLL